MYHKYTYKRIYDFKKYFNFYFSSIENLNEERKLRLAWIQNYHSVATWTGKGFII